MSVLPTNTTRSPSFSSKGSAARMHGGAKVARVLLFVGEFRECREVGRGPGVGIHGAKIVREPPHVGLVVEPHLCRTKEARAESQIATAEMGLLDRGKRLALTCWR